MKTYYPTINLLRGIAATMVCVFHFFGFTNQNESLFYPNGLLVEITQLGVNGVFIFFVISGFVIPLSLLKADYNPKKFHRFIFKRFIRIEIPYIASILLILTFWYLLSLKNNWTFTFNVEQFFYHIFYIIPFSKFEWYNVIYWTLAIEFQFYLLIAVLHYFLSSNNRIVVISTVVLFSATNFIFHDNRFIFQYAVVFSMGIVLYLIKCKKIDLRWGLIMLILLLISSAYLYGFWVFIFSTFTLLAIAFIEIDNSFTKFYGDISYSFYLLHGLIGGTIIAYFWEYFNAFYAKILLVCIAFTSAILFSSLFWYCIENPAKKLSKRVKE